MNIALILTGGVGQRMRTTGLPKQFLKLFGKPIVVYTLEKFENCAEIDEIVVVSHKCWLEHMQKLVDRFELTKVKSIVLGGPNRQESIANGLAEISEKYSDDDVVIIHDGVRPLISGTTICENIRVAERHGNAMTVRKVTESIVVANESKAALGNFMKRDDTYSLTSPQSFKLKELVESYEKIRQEDCSGIPILDASLIYAQLGKEVHFVVEEGHNLKITTPEDFYYLRAILDLEENKYIFGL